MIIECHLQIHAPIDEVYRTSQDYAVRYRWDPFPEHIAMLNNATEIQSGAKVLVIAKSGLRMEVRFVQVLPPTTAAIVMTKGPGFLEKFAGSWVFRAEGPTLTHAKFRYAVKIKKWALPFITEKLAAFYFNRVVQARLTGLKSYCEALRRRAGIRCAIWRS